MAASTAYQYGETVLKVSGVSLVLGGQSILRDVNFEIRNIVRPGLLQGQVVALLGPSGIGKTQLFHILAGLRAPDSGQVLVGVEGKPVERGMVGVVAQSYPLFNHRTVMGNMRVAGRRNGLSAQAVRARADGLLERFGLPAHAGKYPAMLSGGQRQRVAIAQQFMCSEHFLLMDEPFSGLDCLAIDEVIRLIGEVSASHELNTTIAVTHDIAAAIEIADHIWLLGRDRDAQGQVIPGARIQNEFDLIERGLAWRDGISGEPAFQELLQEIRLRFVTL